MITDQILPPFTLTLDAGYRGCEKYTVLLKRVGHNPDLGLHLVAT